MSMHTTTHTTTTHMSRQQEILAGLEDVETAARDSSISRVSQQQIIVNDNNNMSQQHNNNSNFEDERLNLVIQTEGKDGEVYRIRPPFLPKEIAQFHSLLSESLLSGTFTGKHDFLLIFNDF